MLKGKMKGLSVLVLLLAAGICLWVVLRAHKSVPPEAQLQVTFGPRGVQRLVYGADALEDLDAYPSDAFHIWHMRITDPKGKVLPSGDYGWGENSLSKQWNQNTKTWMYLFSWGSIETRFAVTGNTLDIHVTEKNSSTSGVVLDGAAIYPLALHFPKLPAHFDNKAYPQLAFGTVEPSVITADYDSGEVLTVAPDPTKWIYSGFWPAEAGGAYYPLISSTSPDGLATFQPHHDLPVLPGQEVRFTVSLRFAPSGADPGAVAKDAYEQWRKAWPMQLVWNDRRPIGTVYLASSPTGDRNQPGGYPNNPRRYFNDSDPGDFNVKTETGLQAFQKRILAQAFSNVANMKRMNAQGAITWDIEGEQYPQNTSYVCAPDLIAQIAPEMEKPVSVPDSPYNGMKLDDAYFKIMTSAGFQVGVCVRPQHFTVGSDGSAKQAPLDDAAAEAELLRKMRYAHDRWGARLFYIDSSVGHDGAALDAEIFKRLGQALPDSLLIPEESTPKYYAYTSPFRDFMARGDLGTPPRIRNAYPKAFSANLINDADPGTLAAKAPDLTEAVKAGDILLAHVDYWQANNAKVVSIYNGAQPSSDSDSGSNE